MIKRIDIRMKNMTSMNFSNFTKDLINFGATNVIIFDPFGMCDILILCILKV